MSELEQLKVAANEELCAALDLDDEDKTNAALEAAKEKYASLYKRFPNDIEIAFNDSFIPTYLLRNDPVDAKKKAAEVFVEFVAACCHNLNLQDISAEQKNSVLADITTKSEKLLNDYIRNEYARCNMGILFAALGLSRNENAKNWNLDSFDMYKTFLSSLSEQMVEWGLIQTAKLVSGINKAETDNKISCVNYIAKSLLSTASLVYDDSFYNMHLPMIQQLVGVVKTTAPHEVFIIPEPSYDGIALDAKNALLPRYRASQLRKFIDKTNNDAKEEAITRYWETHEGEKESLLVELRLLQEQRETEKEELSKNNSIVAAASNEKKDYLSPTEKEIDSKKNELQFLQERLSKLNIFQGRMKKETRAQIENTTLELAKLQEKYKSMTKEATKQYELKTKDASQLCDKFTKSLKTLNSRIDALKKKLENPLQ